MGHDRTASVVGGDGGESDGHPLDVEATRVATFLVRPEAQEGGDELGLGGPAVAERLGTKFRRDLARGVEGAQQRAGWSGHGLARLPGREPGGPGVAGVQDHRAANRRCP
jgi:hypothetical protein